MKIRPFLCPVISSGDNPPPPRSSTSMTTYEKSSALASVLPALTANHQRVPATHKSEALDIDHSCQVHGKSFADYSSAWSLNLEKTLSTQSGHMNLRSCVDPSFVTFSPSRFFRFASSRFQNIPHTYDIHPAKLQTCIDTGIKTAEVALHPTFDSGV